LSEALAEFRQIQEIESSYKDIETYLATTQWALAKKQEEDQTRSQVSILCCEAEIAMANEDWSTAIEKQQAILVLIPNDQGTIFRLSSARCQREMFLLYESGKQHYEAGRYREALNEFDQIQQKESDYRDVNQLVALVQSDLKKEEAERQAKIAKHYSDALAAIDKEEWAVAMNELQTYLALNPDHIAAAEILSYVRQEQEFSNLYDKGQDHYNAERWDEALSCFQQIQDIKGEYKDAAFLISNAQSQIAKARERERAQSRITLLFREVTSDLAEERWAVAIEKLHAILALDPDHTDAKAELSEAQRQQKLAQMYKQGVAHFEAGRLNEALAELSQVKSTKGTFKNIENLISAIQDKLEKKEKEEPQRTHSAGMPKQSTERIPLPHTNATPEPRQVAHRSLLIIGAGLALVVLVIVIIKFGRQKGSSPIGTLLGVITSLLRVDEVALSPDGLILAVTGEDEAVGLWRVSDHSLIRTLTGRASSGRCVAMSPKGDIVASGAEDGNIYLWQKSDGRLLNTLQSHKNYVFFVSFSEDGEVLFSASYDKTIRMWRVNDGKLLSSITISPQESIITINPDKRIVALYGQNNGVWLRSAVDGKLLETLEGNGYVVKCGAFSPDGQFLALGSTDGAVRLWRTSNGSLVSTVQGEEIKVGSVVFSPDGQKVTAGWGNGVIRLWQISNTNFVKVLEGHTMNVQSIAFNKTGDILASASDDKTIRLWQIKEGGK
jgi:outer membrane protein assembly factor BamD (BamD/ComL family)